MKKLIAITAINKIYKCLQGLKKNTQQAQIPAIIN